ncbi:2-oxoacid:acceptor oxidoreductase family protein [Patescibacteria group bacterium]|nr:2-oxoacid:acceptor oxidoreductase family protein [Patescibacteria group bacterium]
MKIKKSPSTIKSIPEISSDIIIAGEGGHGVQKIGEIIAHTAFSVGLQATYIPNFTVQQRGGVSIAFVRISNQPIIYPKFNKANLAVILSGRSIEHVEKVITNQTTIINNSTLSNPILFKNIKYKTLNSIPATALGKKIGPRSFNMIMLGKIIHDIKILKFEDIENEVTNIFKSKYSTNPELKEQNNKALKIGYEL